MGHRIALKGYDEPGITWTYADCVCGWKGPFRVILEQAAVDTARHLAQPTREDYGDGWTSTMERKAEARQRYAPVFAPWEITEGPVGRDDPRLLNG